MVELDFLYPSEGIHRRWDYGYRITATAATWDQAALILSVPRRKPADETQETLRTCAFPSTHVKVLHLYTCTMKLPLSLSLVHFFGPENKLICGWVLAGEVGKKSLYCIDLLWSYSFIDQPNSVMAPNIISRL